MPRGRRWYFVGFSSAWVALVRTTGSFVLLKSVRRSCGKKWLHKTRDALLSALTARRGTGYPATIPDFKFSTLIRAYIPCFHASLVLHRSPCLKLLEHAVDCSRPVTVSGPCPRAHRLLSLLQDKLACTQVPVCGHYSDERPGTHMTTT